ncbi:MAG TPA: HdeD family acid-resistance protein [Actinospica sp.]|nr:HdeD family acid-resistance protein [Actinospica sp.]
MSETGRGTPDPGTTGVPGPGLPGAPGPGLAGSGLPGGRSGETPGPGELPGPLQLMARGAWQAVLVIGVSAVALGVLTLAWPHATLAVIGVLFGLYLLVSGVLQLVAAFGTHVDPALRVMAFISGAISILLGVFCFRGALESILLLAVWIGIAWMFRGISQLAAAASDPMMPARGWQIFAAVIGIIAGVVVLSSPLTSIWVLILFTGIWLIVTGVVEIATALRIRSHAKQLPQGL